MGIMSLRNKLIIAFFTFVLLLIPLSSYLMLQKAQYEHLISTGLLPNQSPVAVAAAPVTSSHNVMQQPMAAIPTPTPGFILPTEGAVLGEASEATPSSTLKMSAKMSDRAENNQSAKIFVGISEGEVQANPKYVLSFLAQSDSLGNFNGVSLNGLNIKSSYTAYIKGVSQLATTKQFLMNSGVNDLGNLTLIDGDVNNDNAIDQKDLQLVKQNLGKTTSSASFDPNADVNNDGTINGLDLSIVTQNLGKTSSIPIKIPDQTNLASPSASLSIPPDQGGPESTPPADGGYWLWIPKAD
jgi:hypothetical protein